MNSNDITFSCFGGTTLCFSDLSFVFSIAEREEAVSDNKDRELNVDEMEDFLEAEVGGESPDE